MFSKSRNRQYYVKNRPNLNRYLLLTPSDGLLGSPQENGDPICGQRRTEEDRRGTNRGPLADFPPGPRKLLSVGDYLCLHAANHNNSSVHLVPWRFIHTLCICSSLKPSQASSRCVLSRRGSFGFGLRVGIAVLRQRGFQRRWKPEFKCSLAWNLAVEDCCPQGLWWVPSLFRLAWEMGTLRAC